MMIKRRVIRTALFLALLAPSSASAFPIALLGTEGFGIIVNGNDPIVAQYLGNSAYYSNDLYLMMDTSGNPGDDGNLENDLLLFNNHTSPLMGSLDLGTFAVGTELLFRMHVNNTGEDFYSGFGAANSDGMAHARIQADWLPGVSLISFEDLYGCPEVPGGFNDLSFSFSNTTTTKVMLADVSEPPTALLLALGLCGMAISRRFRSV